MVAFFEENKEWFETQEKLEGANPDSQYSLNRKEPFELRKEKIRNWAKEHER